MELKKNDRVIVTFRGGKKMNGIIIGSPYKMFTEKENYIEVYLPLLDLEVPVKIRNIEKI